jgi:L-arabinose isomerase
MTSPRFARRQTMRQVHRLHHLVPHVLAVQDVDQRPQAAAQAGGCHLHTQYNRDIPWATIDMDFMNMNQAAHGDREHGFIMSRMRLNRKVVVGFWQEKSVQEKLGAWAAPPRPGTTGRARSLPLRRQHARSGRDRRRQGGRANQIRLFGQRLRRRRPGQIRQRRFRKGIDALVQEYEDTYQVAADLRKGAASARFRPRGRPHRTRPARVPEGRQFQGLHHHVRGFARIGAVARLAPQR